MPQLAALETDYNLSIGPSRERPVTPIIPALWQDYRDGGYIFATAACNQKTVEPHLNFHSQQELHSLLGNGIVNAHVTNLQPEPNATGMLSVLSLLLCSCLWRREPRDLGFS